MFKEGDTGIITFGDGSTSRVRITKVSTYSFMPTDYILTYEDDETHRPLVHPNFVKYQGSKKIESFPLPEGILEQVFTKD